MVGFKSLKNVRISKAKNLNLFLEMLICD